jgi:hypothetical protein
MTNNELTLPEGLCTFSRGSLVFTRTPTQEEWEQIGRYVHAARGSSLRWMADWRMEGRRRFGDSVVESAEKQLEFEFKDLKAAEALEKLDGVHPAAPSDAHAFVAAKLCKDSYEAQDWLEKARNENLTPVELQNSIKAGEIVREDHEEKPRLNANDRSVGLVTIEGVHMQFNLWLKKVREDDGFPGEWDARRLGMVRDLLTPMADIRSEIGVMILEKGGEV